MEGSKNLGFYCKCVKKQYLKWEVSYSVLKIDSQIIFYLHTKIVLWFKIDFLFVFLVHHSFLAIESNCDVLD